jgi:hypothetical protein
MSMLSKMPGVLGKLAELAGAGLASAAGAYLFAQLARPATPPPLPSQIVQVEPVQEELVRAVRSENAALIQELLKAETAKAAASEPAPPRVAAVAPPKAAKSNQVPVSGHKPNADHVGMGAEKIGIGAEKKSERFYDSDMKAPDMKAPMDVRVPSATATPLVPVSADNPARRVEDSTPAIDQSPARKAEFPWIARLRQIPGIFRPAPRDPGATPRPPLPVGELVSGEM